MTVTYATADGFADRAYELALDLHALLRAIDPGAWRDEAQKTAELRLQALRSRFDGLAEAAPAPELSPLAARVAEVHAVVDRAAPTVEGAARGSWERFRRELVPAYDALARALRESARPVPSLRPTNLIRSGVHALSGLVALAVIQLLPAAWVLPVAAACAGGAWSLETARHRLPAINQLCMSVLGRISHPHEAHRVNSSTWFCTGLLVLALVGGPLAASVGVMVLGFADPAAAMVGRRFGRHRLASGRSVEGALAFVTVGAVVAALTLLMFGGGLTLGAVLAVAMVVGVVGAATELWSGPLDDNFTIPVASGLVVLALLGG